MENGVTQLNRKPSGYLYFCLAATTYSALLIKDFNAVACACRPTIFQEISSLDLPCTEIYEVIDYMSEVRLMEFLLTTFGVNLRIMKVVLSLVNGLGLLT